MISLTTSSLIHAKLILLLQKFGSVHMHWTTHHPRGLSAKDTFMARYCDEQAKVIGAVQKGEHAKCAPAPGSQGSS